MAMLRAPCCLNWRMSVCTATGSGVVCVVACNSPKKPLPTVPMMAQLGVCSKSSIAWASHWVMEVLPLVPVTPMIFRLPERLP